MPAARERISIIGLDFRFMHIILILGAAFLLYSALGLDDEERFVSSGLNLYYLHRYVGLIWGAIIIFYGLYALARRRVRILEPIGRPIVDQIREGFSVVGKYFLNIRISDRVRSGMGRHNVMASYAFVMLIFAFLLLGIGGLGLIYLPGGGEENDFWLGIHLAGAGLLALFVLAHVFAVLNRVNWPLVAAVFSTGKVRREWAEKSMPRYTAEADKAGEGRRYRRVVRKTKVRYRIIK